MIVKVFDPVEQRTRRFVRLGGKMRHWKGPAIKHGKDAKANLKKAAENRMRVVGFEAEADEAALKKGERKVAHFFLDRAHELKRIFEVSGGEVIERLELNQRFEALRYGRPVQIIDPGDLFELVPPRGEMPGVLAAQAGPDEPASVHPDLPEVDGISQLPAGDLDDSGDDGQDEEGLFGETADEKLSTEDYARKCLPALVEHVMRQTDSTLRPLTYLELAERLDRRNKNGDFWARGLGHVLSRVTSMLDQADVGQSEQIPYLTTIVVAGHGPERGLPGVGVKERWPGYESLTASEKKAKVMREYDRILQYGSRWNDVLLQLGIPPIAPSGNESPESKKGGWGGGESPQHKALKRFVVENPQIVGADQTWVALDEYALRSGDSIDVFFKREEAWIAVEVKSAVSDGCIDDYERGLYQVVKYRAVLEAQAKMDHPSAPPTLRVLLLLESHLPHHLTDTAKRLDVEVLEGVKPLSSCTAR